ncbi:MAG TPA: hypothetical protein VF812_15565 [Ktedonobacterales bacterium]
MADMAGHPSPRRRLAQIIATQVPLLALLTLAACGTQGYAPKLGKPVTVALAGSASAQRLGSATFAPFYAAHVATYYKGKAVPFASAQTPVELRSGSCGGKPVAALTEATAAPVPDNPVVAPDAKSGVDVALATSGDLYVVVRQQANDANAPLLACGHPLSGRKQFFDLFTPDQGSNGYSLGIALMEPIIATRVNVAMASPAQTPTTWAVRAGSCSGAPLAQGDIAAGARTGSGVVFAALASSHWRLTLTTSGGQTLCAQVAA